LNYLGLKLSGAPEILAADVLKATRLVRRQSDLFGLGNDDFLTGRGLLDQARQVVFAAWMLMVDMIEISLSMD